MMVPLVGVILFVIVIAVAEFGIVCSINDSIRDKDVKLADERAYAIKKTAVALGYAHWDVDPHGERKKKFVWNTNNYKEGE